MIMRMSIAGAVFALAGCVDGFSPTSLAGAAGKPTMAMLAGGFTAAGPDGYCVDPNGSDPQQGFALMAPCAVTRGVDQGPRVRAIATLQVGAVGSAIVSQDPAAFAAYLGGPDGPLVLSRSGDADTVRIRKVSRSGDQVMVYLVDDAPATIDGMQEAEWRAFVDIAGRLVTIAVRGLDAAPLSEAAGAVLLRQSIDAVIRANATAPTQS